MFLRYYTPTHYDLGSVAKESCESSYANAMLLREHSDTDPMPMLPTPSSKHDVKRGISVLLPVLISQVRKTVSKIEERVGVVVGACDRG